MIRIELWKPEFREVFEALNREWIERYFAIEPHDLEVFANPQKTIVDGGGQIFFAFEDEKAVGCCALINHGEGEYEISKLAVSPTAQGKGIASLMFDSLIAYALKINTKRLIIESNTTLAPAMHLYQKYGFERVGDFIPSYKRVDVRFEKNLTIGQLTIYD